MYVQNKQTHVRSGHATTKKYSLQQFDLDLRPKPRLNIYIHRRSTFSPSPRDLENAIHINKSIHVNYFIYLLHKILFYVNTDMFH